ncbi:MAG TPA: hypothetical protein VGG28_21875 [Kofleriaceae bacterium]
MKRSSLLALAIGVLLAACGDDHPYVPGDSGSGSNVQPGGTLTDFVIDLIENHSNDPTPAAYSTFSTLPDPDGSNNNGSAYSSLF